MRRGIVMFLLMLLGYLLQSCVFRIIPVSFIRPNLLLMIVVTFAFMRGRKSGMILGFVCGLFVDLLSSPIIGFTSLIYLLIGYVVGFCFNIFFDEDVKVPVILVGLCNFVYRVLFFGYYFVLIDHISWKPYFVYTLLPEVLSTVIFTFFLYKILHMIDKKLSEYELEEQQSPWLRK